MDKTIIKAVTKTKGEDTEDVYGSILHKLYLEKQLRPKNFRGKRKKQWKA